MRNELSVAAIALCVALGSQQSASAQGTFGNVNANNRSYGSSSSYRTSSNYGGTSVAGGVAGGRNAPVAGAGSAVGNLGGRDLDLTQGTTTTGRTLFSEDQFRVGNRQLGQFVGTSMFDPASFIGATTAGATSSAAVLGGRRQLGGVQQGRSMARPGGAPGGRNAATSIRAAARLAFEAPQVDPGQVSASLVRRLQQPGQMQTRLPVEVTIDGQIATLRGQVATEYDRILAERFVRLEPGISQVANELVVGRTSTDTSEAPPQSPTPVEPN
ncbi:MAG TPA: BON domain-containing protein [Thermoguttaceae bacterium]|nr:BON domain-containing protein [Thermoguttaceae bacterium]